jgi:hypothetical protein
MSREFSILGVERLATWVGRDSIATVSGREDASFSNWCEELEVLRDSVFSEYMI